MTKSLRAAIVCFILATIFLFILLDVNGLADESSIGVTPLLWLESKSMQWDGVQYTYRVTGWWFTDGEYPGHHVGDWRTFPVTRDVFWDVLTRDPQDRMTQRLCKLGFVDGEYIASVASCVNGTQYWLPLNIK